MNWGGEQAQVFVFLSSVSSLFQDASPKSDLFPAQVFSGTPNAAEGEGPPWGTRR